MKNIVKPTYFAVLLAVSLAVANPAFGAGMKINPADNAVVLADLSPNEGYSGGYTAQNQPDITVARTPNTDLSPNEGYSGGYTAQTLPDITVADASTLNTDLSPTEGYSGGYSAEIVKEASSGMLAQAEAVLPSTSRHRGAGQ